MINLFQPQTDDKELTALSHTLSTHWLGKGLRVTEFEAAWANQVGTLPANMVSTNSCTSALFEAVRLSGIGPGDEVILPTIHFVGAAQAVLAVGATPVFCDVDRWTLNATTETLLAKLTANTWGIILNAYGGIIPPINWESFPKRLMVIADLANAPAATFDAWGWCDYATWSFDAMKIITTGDGGMLYCADPDKAQQARQDFYLGTSSGSGLSNPNERWWEFSVQTPGVGRHLMNDLQAAMGLAQLEKLAGFVARRKEIVKLYDDWWGGYGRYIMGWKENKEAYYFYWIHSTRRDALAKYLREHGIYTSFRYWPLHLAYNQSLYYHLPNAEWAAQHALNLPLHNSLTDQDVHYVCETIRAFYQLGK